MRLLHFQSRLNHLVLIPEFPSNGQVMLPRQITRLGVDNTVKGLNLISAVASPSPPEAAEDI